MYEFVDESWTQTAVLQMEAPTHGDGFGRSLAVLGQELLIGALGSESLAEAGGVVRTFSFDGGLWSPASWFCGSP